MKAVLVASEFLLIDVQGTLCRIEVLNRAIGTAKHYWSFSFLAADPAKPALPDRIAANEAFLWDGAVELRCTRLMIGRAFAR